MRHMGFSITIAEVFVAGIVLAWGALATTSLAIDFVVAYLTGFVLMLVAVVSSLLFIASWEMARPFRVQSAMQHWITQHQVLAFDLMWTLRGALLVVWIAFFIDWGRAIRANFFE